MSAVLVARGVYKSYGRHQVLAGAYLTVEAGQLVAVVHVRAGDQEGLQ